MSTIKIIRLPIRFFNNLLSLHYQNHPEESFILFENKGTDNEQSMIGPADNEIPDSRPSGNEKNEQLVSQQAGREHNLAFTPIVLPVEESGRWLAMDSGDIDGDGDIDIVLGNFSRAFLTESGLDPSWDTKTPFVLLKNNLR